MNEEKEIQEALDAVENTLRHLIRAKEYLNSAANWGIFDVLGGGFITTVAKRSKMHDAQEALEAAKRSVHQLKKELADVNEALDMKLFANDFLNFADYFFDGVVADWLVQSKINDAKKQVNQAIDSLNEVKKRLLSL